jgi:TolB-like protein
MTATRRLAAILAADVAGYSRLIGEDEEGTLNRLKAIRTELIDPTITEHRGRIVKTTGDGLLVEFASVVDGLRCAAKWQAGMAGHDAATQPKDRIEFRIGIHQGDIVVDGDDIFGDGVNVAARLEGLADPGGICVSARVQEDTAGRLVRVYRVRLETAETPKPAPIEIAPVLALPDKPSIAVLPFQNMSGDPEQEYFADGMVEEIITALSRIRWLFVIARNSSFAYKGKSPDLRQVGHELGVRYVLEGSVRKAGNRVRITGQLIDSTTGAHIWADRIDGSLDDIFELQDKVASSVAGAIEPRLRQSEIERVSRKPTNSLDAYDLYLRAAALRDQHTDESVREAIVLLKRALAIDPTYAPAAALAGWSRIHQLSHGRIPVSPSEAAEAVTLARQALEAGKDDPDALWMAAFTLLLLTGEHAVAATAIDRALTLNPNSAHAWMARGYVSCARGQPDAAIEALERAIRLNPLDRLSRTFTNGIAVAHLVAGRYDEALDWADRTLREEPGYSGALRSKAIACAHLGRIDEAREAVHQLIEAQPWQTIARNRVFYSRVYPPEIAEIYVDGLRKAGLPEE